MEVVASLGLGGASQYANCRSDRSADFLAQATSERRDASTGPFRCSIEQQRSVDNVHTFHLGLVRTPIGLARIPHVSATSQCFQT